MVGKERGDSTVGRKESEYEDRRKNKESMRRRGREGSVGGNDEC